MASADAKLTCSLHLTTPLTFLDEAPAHYLRRMFNCDLCNRSGKGPRYHCKTCQFDLHPACCVVQTTLRSWAHPAHSLTLMPAYHHASSRKRCDGCRHSLAGCEWSYRCEACNFDLHASCAKLREWIMTRYHRPGPLKLLKKSPYPPRRLQCDVCNERMPTNGWVYHCTSCNFDLHPSCALLPASPLCSAHPHRLTMGEYFSIDPSKCYLCSVCLEFGGRFGFRCEKCDFDIHPKCLVSSLPGSSSAYAPHVHTRI